MSYPGSCLTTKLMLLVAPLHISRVRGPLFIWRKRSDSNAQNLSVGSFQGYWITVILRFHILETVGGFEPNRMGVLQTPALPLGYTVINLRRQRESNPRILSDLHDLESCPSTSRTVSLIYGKAEIRRRLQLGGELWVHFCTHAFQACSLNHSDTFP
jgi:hypothetical protein